MFKNIIFGAFLWVLLLSDSTELRAQTTFASEQHFQELFVTAGYSTAFGAALGAAALGLTHEPAENLQFIVTGASIGFIMGSIVGTYVIFTPVLTYGGNPNIMSSNGYEVSKEQPLQVRPALNLESGSLESVDMAWMLASF